MIFSVPKDSDCIRARCEHCAVNVDYKPDIVQAVISALVRVIDERRVNEQCREGKVNEMVDHIVPPVDRSQRTLTDGSPETPDHSEILADGPRAGQQKGYVVLSAEERAKGFVRPVRRTYLHRTCGTTTTMGLSIAETHARDPSFYDGTCCVSCCAHFPLEQFVWEGTEEQVGS